MPVAEPFKFGEEDIDEEIIVEEEQQDSRPKTSRDPFEKNDPWNQQDTSGSSRKQFAGAVTHPGPGTNDGGNTRKMMHDVPPEWDGGDPGKNLEPYLKLLQGWLATTATIQHQETVEVPWVDLR